MDEHQISGSARILKDNEGRLINILGRVSHLRLFFPSFLRLFFLFLLSRFLFTPCSPRRDGAFALRRLVRQIAIATASLITGFCVLAPRLPRPRPHRRAARKICTRTYPRDGRDDRPPVLPTHARMISGPAMSCRIYSLTLDTVPSIQRHFSERSSRATIARRE